jgi:hypothetical protein
MITNQILYKDEDTRLNIHEVNTDYLGFHNLDLIEAVQRQARSVACLIHEHFVYMNTNPYQLKNITHTVRLRIKYGFPLAEDEKFRDELAPGFASGFLVGPRTMATAAHCVCKKGTNELDLDKIAKTLVVFNYTTNPDGTQKTSFNADQIFRIRRVKAHFYKHAEIDWAWVTLDRDVPNTQPLELDFNPATSGRGLYMLGHPSGLAMKLSTEATVKKVTTTFIKATIDSIHANSGSPILDRITKKVIAILITGPGSPFRVALNHAGPGKHRLKTARANLKNTLLGLHPRGQLISALPVDHPAKTAYYAKLDQDKRAKKSNFKANFAEMAFKCVMSVGKAASKVQGVASICICSKDFQAKRKEFAESLHENERYISDMQDLKSTHTINFLEADYMHWYPGMQGLTLPDQVRLARNLAAYGEEDGAAVFSIERLFGDRFSPIKILELFKFQSKIHADLNTQEFKEYMLEYMHNPSHTIAQAYIKACYKILKHKEGFQGLSKAHLKQIAELVVKKAPALNFNKARQELKL